MTFTAKCRKVGFTEKQIETVRRYRTKHKELADEEVIARYKLNGFVKKTRELVLDKRLDKQDSQKQK